MPARRNWRLDLAACAWLAVGVLAAYCVSISNDSVADTASAHTLWAADVGRQLNDTFGISVFFLLIVEFVTGLSLFLRRGLARWLVRLAGWVLLVPLSAVLAEQLWPDVRQPGLELHGGVLGRRLSEQLTVHVPVDARPMLLSLGIALATVLALGDVLVYLLRAAVFVLRAVFGYGPSVPAEYLSDIAPVSPKKRRERKAVTGEVVARPPRGPSEPEVEAEEPGEPMIIPIRRPGAVSGTSVANGTGAQLKVANAVPIQTPVVGASGIQTPVANAPGSPRLSLLRFLRPQPATPKSTVQIAPAVRPSDKDHELPALALLEEPEPFPYEQHEQKLRDLAALLEKTFADFELNVRVVGINTGPVVTQFEIALETGLRVHKVTRLADDLALNLKVQSVRVVAPIPGKSTVGIEVPNEVRANVRLKEVLRLSGPSMANAKIPLFLGKDTEGKPLVQDLADMPHLLIAGRTGTGKSVCMNAIILSILMTRGPDEVKMVMIDPKMLELSEYGKIPHLMHPVVKDMKKAEAILSWAVDKMEERYDILSRARVRSIAGYNELPREEIHRRLGLNSVSGEGEGEGDDSAAEERARIPDRMPYIVIFVDEMNDLMMTMKKEVEGHIIRLAQKSRAAGIHLVVATQKPTVDVITGLIKSNLPARVCFQVSSRTDSRVVLDEMGAEKLLGKGDMLFLIPGTSTIVRAQGTYASDAEIAGVVKHLECEPNYVHELIQIGSTGEPGASAPGGLRARDELYEAAIEVVIREGRGSVSLLQRALGIGYGRAARLVDYMAEDGIVGDYNGSQAREVLYTPEQWEALRDKDGDEMK